MMTGGSLSPRLGLEQGPRAAVQRQPAHDGEHRAASVEDTTAPSSSAVRTSTSSSSHAAVEVTATLIATPRVARDPCVQGHRADDVQPGRQAPSARG